jgi:hypothetical protein
VYRIFGKEGDIVGIVEFFINNDGAMSPQVRTAYNCRTWQWKYIDDDKMDMLDIVPGSVGDGIARGLCKR